MLRIVGKKLDLKAALRALPMKPELTVERGTLGPTGRKHTRSIISVLVSRAEFDAPAKQVKDATRVLRKHAVGLRRVCRRADVEIAALDFGIYKRDAFMQAEFFPRELIELMGKIGLSLEVSLYNAPDEE